MALLVGLAHHLVRGGDQLSGLAGVAAAPGTPDLAGDAAVLFGDGVAHLRGEPVDGAVESADLGVEDVDIEGHELGSLRFSWRHSGERILSTCTTTTFLRFRPHGVGNERRPGYLAQTRAVVNARRAARVFDEVDDAGDVARIKDVGVAVQAADHLAIGEYAGFVFGDVLDSVVMKYRPGAPDTGSAPRQDNDAAFLAHRVAIPRQRLSYRKAFSTKCQGRQRSTSCAPGRLRLRFGGTAGMTSCSSQQDRMAFVPQALSASKCSASIPSISSTA